MQPQGHHLARRLPTTSAGQPPVLIASAQSPSYLAPNRHGYRAWASIGQTDDGTLWAWVMFDQIAGSPRRQRLAYTGRDLEAAVSAANRLLLRIGALLRLLHPRLETEPVALPNVGDVKRALAHARVVGWRRATPRGAAAL
jgi:hypothetical protein